LVLATALPGFNASFDVLGNGGYHRTLCDGMSVFKFLRFGTLVGGLQKKTYKKINPFHVWPSNTTISSLILDKATIPPSHFIFKTPPHCTTTITFRGFLLKLLIFLLNVLEQHWFLHIVVM